MAGKTIDERVDEYFEAAVNRALEDPETKEKLEELAGHGRDVSVAKVRAELLSRREPILERTQTMLSGWRLAEERRDEARLAARQRWIRVALVGLAVGLPMAVLLFFVLPDSAQWFSVAALVAPAFYLYLLAFNFPLLGLNVAALGSRHRFVEALDAQATVAVREVTNERLISFRPNFEIFDRRGLRQLADPDREVSTKAASSLQDLIASLDSGSIGLSGPRGCGKSTLIKSFTEGRSMPFDKGRIGLTIAAPVQYDPREFILHLFASLCEKVLTGRRDTLARAGARWTREKLRRRQWITGAAALISIAAGLVILLDVQVPSRHTSGVILAVIGGILAIAWMIIWFERSALGEKFNRQLGKWLNLDDVAGAGAVESAGEYLKQIRFQQSRETGGSAELKLPLGLGFGANSSSTLARTPWTLPEAVEEFRRFAATLSRRYVVIGIDELDKMESDEAAREFLNNVKGVFGVEGCYFLVSVSEDAMSAFERRGLPMRDVFDSSFDEIQRVGYLTLEESRGLFESRVTGVSVPFQCLCHCLAGGLPRDLIRTMRELDNHYQEEIARVEGGPPTLDNLAHLLVTTEWQDKVAGAVAAGRSTVAPPPWRLTTWLHEMDGAEPKSDSLRDWTVRFSREAGGLDAGDEETKRIAVEMMTFNYYAATLLEFFSSTGVASELRDLTDPEGKTMDGVEVAKLETLAKARQQFAIDPRLAWQLVGQARQSAGLATW